MGLGHREGGGEVGGGRDLGHRVEGGWRGRVFCHRVGGGRRGRGFGHCINTSLHQS